MYLDSAPAQPHHCLFCLCYLPWGMPMSVLACPSASHTYHPTFTPQTLPSFLSSLAAPPSPLLKAHGQCAVAFHLSPQERPSNMSPSFAGVWRLQTLKPCHHPSWAGHLCDCHPVSAPLTSLQWAMSRKEMLCQTARQSLSYEEKHRRTMNIDLGKGLGCSLEPGGRWLLEIDLEKLQSGILQFRHSGCAAGRKTQSLAQSPWNKP